MDSSLQRDISFIPSLWREAKSSLLSKGKVRDAKAILLVACLFEQCRMVEFSELGYFLQRGELENNLAMEKEFRDMFPFYYYRGHIATRSKEIMQSYLQHLDIDEHIEEVHRAEPTMRIKIEGKECIFIISVNHLLHEFWDANEEAYSDALIARVVSNGRIFRCTLLGCFMTWHIAIRHHNPVPRPLRSFIFGR
jgi:hypothetical protein